VRCAIATAVLLSFAIGARAEPKHPPRYLDAVRQELARLGVDAACEPDAGACSFRWRLTGLGVDLDATVACSDKTNTVYVAIPRFLALAGSEGPPVALAHRLLELNRRLVTTKLEWDALAGSIRLTTVLSTDSNFDRKAFRSQVLALFAAAERILPELEVLAAAPK